MWLGLGYVEEFGRVFAAGSVKGKSFLPYQKTLTPNLKVCLTGS